MQIKLIDRENEGELLIIGRIDPNTVDETEKILIQMAERFNTIILNLYEMDYISSAGLKVLRDLNTILTRKGGMLKIKGTNKNVMEVFEMTGFAGTVTFI